MGLPRLNVSLMYLPCWYTFRDHLIKELSEMVLNYLTLRTRKALDSVAVPKCHLTGPFIQRVKHSRWRKS
jgi:hypothetical protein